LINGSKITYLGEDFSDTLLEGVFVVIAATDDPNLNRLVSRVAKKKGLLVNAVDQPADCNFIVPSILRRGHLCIAVSTSGKSPAMAKKVREDLEALFGPEYESLLNLLASLREVVLARGRTGEENKRIFQGIVYSPVLDYLREQKWDELTSLLNKLLDARFSAEDVRRMAASG